MRRRNTRKLAAELERLERAARAARDEREQLEASDPTPRARSVLAAARRREQALRIAVGDCGAEMFKLVVRDGGRDVGDGSGLASGGRP
ncbi:MAG TPA: hypothetical protein VE528_00530 [Thermoleophilaceae bacterium]|nr:hypothetical protein [Thermoleophilaceae bacterium]